MRWKVFFSALCMVLIVIIGILAIRISSLHSLNSFQIGNLEVLTASETYYLDDCQYGTTFGSNMVYDSFCVDYSSEYFIYDCIYQYRAPLQLYGKCVQSVN